MEIKPREDDAIIVDPIEDPFRQPAPDPVRPTPDPVRQPEREREEVPA